MSYAKDCIIPYQSVLPKADQLLTKVVEEPGYQTNDNDICLRFFLHRYNLERVSILM